MPTRITTEMINALGGAYTTENVRRVRALLSAAGVGDIELHPLELAELREQRARERIARAGAERIIALGPMPPHACTTKKGLRIVDEHNDCLHGCRPGELRRESA